MTPHACCVYVCRLFEQQKELSWAASGRPAAGMPPAVQDARPWTATTITSYGSKVEEVRPGQLMQGWLRGGAEPPSSLVTARTSIYCIHFWAEERL